MALSAGTRLGPYEIVTLLGAGGMGEVYRARDTKLKREVAIKVLPDAFARDPDRMARFQREAEVLASLNHPNIAHIYAVEEGALAMELVEGATLAGPLPIDTALNYARQIAEALEYAHERGVIHRDLKPANVKITADGAVKLLDFGLAKAIEDPVSSGDDPSNSPTLTLGATRLGVILGTAAYMSPEQASGKTADRRADIWSFGAVLYEMLSGKQAFRGESASDTLATVLKLDPDWNALPKETPGSIGKLLRRCLTKDRKQRLQAIGEARIALENPSRNEPAAIAPTMTPSRHWPVAAALLAVALVGVSWIAWRATRPVAREWVRLDVDLGADVSFPDTVGDSVIVSPQGNRLVYISGSERKLFTRRLDQPTASELPGTEGAVAPFFSADGQWVGFLSDRSVKKISVEGGASVSIASLPFTGGSWGEDGNILIGSITGIIRIPSGGSPATLMKVNGELADAKPVMLPRGRAVLFTSFATLAADKGDVEALNLADHRRKVLARGRDNPVFVPSGHLIYTNGSVLFAVAFDSDKLETRGAEVPVLNDIEPDSFGFGDVSISRDGTLVYRKAAGATAGSTIDWLDAAGKRQTLLAKPGAYANPRFSPDGKRLAMLVREGSGQNVWVYDLERGTNSRLTDSGTVTALAWSPDGRYVVLGGLGTSLMEVRSDGSSQPQPLFQNDKGFPTPRPGSFPPGGRLAFFDEILQQIWTAPVREQGGQLKAGQPEQFLQTTSQSPSPAVSPDGHWLAYQSESTGKSEIYVRAFPQPGVGDQVPISNDGGTQPVWTKHDLLYQSGDRIMAVSYTVNGNQFMPDKPRVWLAKLDGATGWDLAPGGQRVAVITPVGGSEAPKAGHEIVMWQNFFDYLRQRVPVK